jgi:hypothetical protein
LFLIFVFLIGTAATSLAQVDTASVVGTVRDASGAVLAGATATATNVDTGIQTTVKTGEDGNYVITPLKIGRYTVSAEATGFRKEVRENIILDVQQRARIDFSMQVGSVTETANVSGEPPLLETETASLGDVIATPTWPRSLQESPRSPRGRSMVRTRQPTEMREAVSR